MTDDRTGQQEEPEAEDVTYRKLHVTAPLQTAWRHLIGSSALAKFRCGPTTAPHAQRLSRVRNGQPQPGNQPFSHSSTVKVDSEQIILTGVVVCPLPSKLYILPITVLHFPLS